MGIIQKTRDNSALMLIVIGGALLAFILTEYLSSSNSTSELDTTVGEFNGVEISDKEFASEREKIVFLTNGGESFASSTQKQKASFTDDTWRQILRDKFHQNQAEELGIKVTGDEEEEMLVGNLETKTPAFYFYVNYLFGGSDLFQKNRDEIAQNPSDISKYAYMAVINRQSNQIIKQVRLDNGKDLWVRDFGIKLKEQEKLQRVLSSCFYTTTSLAKDEFLANNSNKDVEVGFVAYSSINDSSIEPTMQEIEAAYEEIKYQFVEKENSRKLVFATFDLQPSKEDKQAVLEDIAGLKITLDEEENTKLFIKNETDANELVDFSYYKKGEYPEKIAGIDTKLFQLKKGDTYGPFTNPDQSKYGVAKVLDVKQLADSAKFEMARVEYQPALDKIAAGDSSYEYSAEDQQKFQTLYSELADSLLEEVQSKKFSSISKDFIYIDSSYIKDGKLQWAQLSANIYGRDFMDSIITCKVGDVKKVFIPTKQGGFFALIKIRKFGVKSKKMQIGTIIKNVLPGDNTQEDYMSRANQVAFAIKEGKDLTSFSDSLNYVLDSADVKGSTYSLNDITDSRKIIYWAFNTEFDEPSNVFTTPKKYIVGVVKSENKSKFKSLEDPYVKYVCEAHARKQKQKANILNNFPEINANNLQSLAEAYNALKVTKESSVNLKKGSSKFSRESEVNGNIAGLSKDKTSDIIEGEEGVYVVKVLNEYDAEITENTTFDLEKNQLRYAAQRNSNLLVDEYITEKADLTDNRKILR